LWLGDCTAWIQVLITSSPVSKGAGAGGTGVCGGVDVVDIWDANHVPVVAAGEMAHGTAPSRGKSPDSQQEVPPPSPHCFKDGVVGAGPGPWGHSQAGVCRATAARGGRLAMVRRFSILTEIVARQVEGVGTATGAEAGAMVDRGLTNRGEAEGGCPGTGLGESRGGLQDCGSTEAFETFEVGGAKGTARHCLVVEEGDLVLWAEVCGTGESGGGNKKGRHQGLGNRDKSSSGTVKFPPDQGRGDEAQSMVGD
ncbi:unnamed protein product, partial [Discosporangium mesarthrocarpum]